MSKPYDATSEDLIEADPAGWVTYLGHPVSPEAVRLVDADVSTVTADADKVIRVDEPSPWLLHVEIQADWDGDLARRLLRYNVLLAHRHKLPVASVAVLLCPAANVTALTGALPNRPPIGVGWEFRYDVLRVWERPVAEFLAGPLGLLPLAPIADVREAELPGVVEAMKARLDLQPDQEQARLWTASYVLAGLRTDRPLATILLSGVRQMEQSTTYQEIMERGAVRGRREGELTEARSMLLLIGGEKFGAPGPAVTAAVAAITDKARLEALARRVFAAASWDDLLATN